MEGTGAKPRSARHERWRAFVHQQAARGFRVSVVGGEIVLTAAAAPGVGGVAAGDGAEHAEPRSASDDAPAAASPSRQTSGLKRKRAAAADSHDQVGAAAMQPPVACERHSVPVSDAALSTWITGPQREHGGTSTSSSSDAGGSSSAVGVDAAPPPRKRAKVARDEDVASTRRQSPPPQATTSASRPRPASSGSNSATRNSKAGGDRAAGGVPAAGLADASGDPFEFRDHDRDHDRDDDDDMHARDDRGHNAAASSSSRGPRGSERPWPLRWTAGRWTAVHHGAPLDEATGRPAELRDTAGSSTSDRSRGVSGIGTGSPARRRGTEVLQRTKSMAPRSVGLTPSIAEAAAAAVARHLPPPLLVRARGDHTVGAHSSRALAPAMSAVPSPRVVGGSAVTSSAVRRRPLAPLNDQRQSAVRRAHTSVASSSSKAVAAEPASSSSASVAPGQPWAPSSSPPRIPVARTTSAHGSRRRDARNELAEREAGHDGSSMPRQLPGAAPAAAPARPLIIVDGGPPAALLRAANPSFKFVPSGAVRGKAREGLRGFDCDMCRKWYEATGIDLAAYGTCPGHDAPGARSGGEGAAARMKNAASRHRAALSPDHTPPGYWDLDDDSLPSPDR